MGKITHKHHIIPRHMGGTDDPINLVEVTITQHIMFHYANWKLYGKKEDEIAWKGLSGHLNKEEIIQEKLSLAGKKAYELGLGVHSRSKEEMTENGKKSGEKAKRLGLGIHSLTPDERKENSRKGGKISGEKNYELGIGIHSLTSDQKSQVGRKGGIKAKELCLGFHSQSKEQRIENNKKAGKKVKELGVGFFALTKEQMTENGRRGCSITNSQKWKCLETDYVSTPAGLSRYQKSRGIDPSKRIRLQ